MPTAKCVTHAHLCYIDSVVDISEQIGVEIVTVKHDES